MFEQLHIRTATIGDIPAILDLLRLSRGEQSIPKTIDYWEWKHLHNPFGHSPVFLAEIGGELVGLRTMMQWQWQKVDKIFKALRAVDTTTHPAYQGKGIFSKLTLAMVDHVKQEGYDFIFNTPNEKSRPGYLKMGWKDAGRVRVCIQVFVHGFGKSLKNDLPYVSSSSELSALLTLHNQYNKSTNLYYTPKSVAYLNWRYRYNPVIGYTVFEKKGVFIAAYIKKGKLKELRISECVSDFSVESMMLIKGFIKTMAKEHQVWVLSCSPDLAKKLGGVSFVLPIGPLLAVRELNAPGFQNNRDCIASIGDMELF